MTNTKTAKDFADVKYFLPYNFDFSRCYYDEDQHRSYFIADLSKLGTEVEDLIDNNLGLLLEYDDTMIKSDTVTKRVNICIFHANTQSIIDRCDNQIIGNKYFYDRLDFIAKHLKVQNSIVQQTVEIEPDIKALFDELQKYDKYQFYFVEHDKDGRTTFGFELISNKVKLCGYKIDFFVKDGEDRHSAFSINNNICKIIRNLDGNDLSDRYYHESYTFTIYFKDSDTPLEFYSSKTEHRKEVL